MPCQSSVISCCRKRNESSWLGVVHERALLSSGLLRDMCCPRWDFTLEDCTQWQAAVFVVHDETCSNFVWRQALTSSRAWPNLHKHDIPWENILDVQLNLPFNIICNNFSCFCIMIHIHWYKGSLKCGCCCSSPFHMPSCKYHKYFQHIQLTCHNF